MGLEVSWMWTGEWDLFPVLGLLSALGTTDRVQLKDITAFQFGTVSLEPLQIWFKCVSNGQILTNFTWGLGKHFLGSPEKMA